MPVDVGLPHEGMIFQRAQYAKEGVGRCYWDYRDRRILHHVVGQVIGDVGCGEGITLEKLLIRCSGRQVYGIDAEAENVAICREHGLPIIAGSVYSLPLAAASFDCLVFSEVIEHLDAPMSALGELVRVLKPGGRLIVVIPNDRTLFLARLVTGRWREATYDPGHVRQWTPDALHAALVDAGLSVIARENLPGWLWSLSLHHLVVAEKR